MNEIKHYSEDTFESIKHINEFGQEYRFARELQFVLEYTQWRYFETAIERAMKACEKSGIDSEDHFAHVRKMVEIGSGASREIDDYELSRYACYLIVMNGDQEAHRPWLRVHPGEQQNHTVKIKGWDERRTYVLRKTM